VKNIAPKNKKTPNPKKMNRLKVSLLTLASLAVASGPIYGAVTGSDITCEQIADGFQLMGTGTILVNVVDDEASFTIPSDSLVISRKDVLANSQINVEYPLSHDPIPLGVEALFTASISNLPVDISASDVSATVSAGQTQTTLSQILNIGPNPGDGIALVSLKQTNTIIPANILTVPPVGQLPLPLCELCTSFEVSMTGGGHLAEFPPGSMLAPGQTTFGLSHRKNRNNCCGANQNQTDYEFITRPNPWIEINTRLNNLTPNQQINAVIDYTPVVGAPPVVNGIVEVDVFLRGPRAMAQQGGTSSCPAPSDLN